MTGTRPLPRSLTPAPGELLPSFLLRLSHRLRIAPKHLASHCGLLRPPVTTFPARHLLQLEPDLAQALARSFSLSLTEVHGLTLARQAPGFPPLHPDYLGRARAFENVVSEGWVFTRFSRYCPECLAEEDGASAASWHGIWRLPITLACLRHRRFLDWLCPDCGNPAFSSGLTESGRWPPASLVPTPLAVLHPAQCRSRTRGDKHSRTRPPQPCGSRLDQRRPTSSPPPDIIHLQERLLRLATRPEPDAAWSVGNPASAAEHFNDLRAAMLLICGTWPTAADLFSQATHLDAIASHVDDRLRAVSTRKQHGQLASTIRALDIPPPEASTCAALISLASQALTAPEAIEYLDGLLARCDIRWPGRTKILQMEPHCSAGFRAAAATRLDTIRIRRPGIRATFPQSATHQATLAATDIPQRLPDTWTAQLHGLGAPMRGPHLRRDAAIRLVQMAHGGTRRQAAIYLGFDACTAHNTSMRLRQWQASGDNARHYEQALARLADHITTTPRLTDYRWRRDDLSQWVISEEDWDVIIESVRRRQTPTGRPQTKWQHTRRLAATVFVWTHVTGGERLYAPVLRDLRNRRSPHLRETANESWWLEHRQRTSSSIHTLLAAALSEYAAGLATRIDQQVPPACPGSA